MFVPDASAECLMQTEICMSSPTMLHDPNCWITFSSVTHWLPLCGNTSSIQTCGCPRQTSPVAKQHITAFFHTALYVQLGIIKCCVHDSYRYILYSSMATSNRILKITIWLLLIFFNVYVHFCMLISCGKSNVWTLKLRGSWTCLLTVMDQICSASILKTKHQQNISAMLWNTSSNVLF